MKKKSSILFSILFLLVGTISSILFPQAKVEASEFNFYVEAILPENQRDSGATYFDLLVTPGLEQDLEVLLRNDMSQPVTVKVVLAHAKTSNNGAVAYNDTETEKDESLEIALDDIMETEPVVTIPANTEIILPMELAIPEENFDGIVLGGVTFEEVVDEEEEADDSEEAGFSIKNRFAYTIGIMLRQNEDTVSPDLLLHQVFPGQRNYRNVIYANIQNTTPTLVNQLEIEAEIVEKDQEENLYEYSAESLQMAPNSNFDFAIPLEGEEMSAGLYTAKIGAQSSEDEWYWEMDFEITEEEAREYNEQDVSIERDNSLFLYVIIGILLLIVIVLVIYLIISKRRKDGEASIEE